MNNIYVPIIFAVIIGVTYFFSNRFNIKNKNYNHSIISLSAGVSITYLLLELFPTFTESAISINKLLFLTVPVGFISHHLIEKYIYKHNRYHELIKMLTLEDNIFSFIYHIVIGIVMVTFTQENIVGGLLFFMPILSFTFVSTLPTNRHPSFFKSIFLSSPTLLGVIIAVVLPLSETVKSALIGIALGVLLFTVIRHHIPFGRKGRISYFTIGFLLYTILIVGSWYI